MSPRKFFLPARKRVVALLVAVGTLGSGALAARALEPVANPEPFLKKDDVIAFVGGEDLVAAAEYGYLELLLQRALPDHHLKFRSLAWEGDTVFEQHRDLNYPTLEQQLDQIGATVVLCQFGQMESLTAGKNEPRRRGGAEVGKREVEEFIVAYEKLIARLRGDVPAPVDPSAPLPAPRSQTPFGNALIPATPLPSPPPRNEVSPPNALPNGVWERGQKRRLALLRPTDFAEARESLGFARQDFIGPDSKLIDVRNQGIAEFAAAIQRLAKDRGFAFIDPSRGSVGRMNMPTRDGVHLNDLMLAMAAGSIAQGLIGDTAAKLQDSDAARNSEESRRWETIGQLGRLIVAKNRLWFHYYRPQNWAFLAGDRVNQPSSRDHLDPTKRWFPAEMEQWLPLIDAKEKEIWELAGKLANP